jgi:cation diffusion facilitator family transporter
LSATPQTLAFASIGVAMAVLLLKWIAYAATGSLALYSDALESMINVATALIALVALHLAARPPDRHHHFGHHKAEYFAAVAEGVLIVFAAGMIVRDALAALVEPKSIRLTAAAFAFSLAATVLNAAWAMVLLRAGRRMRSPALSADGKHLMADVASTIAVLMGLVGLLATGWTRFDAMLAIAVALYILWSGARLLRTSLSGLMDEAVTAEVGAQIEAIIAANAQGSLQAHALRTRVAGHLTFIEFHLVVPGTMSVADAHAICDRLEAALERAISGTQVTIHVEPQSEALSAAIPTYHAAKSGTWHSNAAR